MRHMVKHYANGRWGIAFFSQRPHSMPAYLEATRFHRWLTNYHSDFAGRCEKAGKTVMVETEKDAKDLHRLYLEYTNE